MQGNNTKVDDEIAGVPNINDTEMDARYGPRLHNHKLRPRKTRNFDHLINVHFHDNFDEVNACYLADCFLTEQMNVNQGLKRFGEKGAEAVIEEMRQLHYQNVIKPVYRDSLT